MDNMDNFRARCEVFEQRTEHLQQHTHLAGRGWCRWWGIMFSLLIVGLVSLPLPSGTAQVDAETPHAASYTFKTIDVPFPPGAHDTSAAGINDRGQIVGGYLDSANGDQGFLDDRGLITTIPSTEPQDINNRRQITGFYGDRSGVHGFLCDRHGFTTLNVPDATLTEASGINDHGQIVGDYRDSHGVFHGFLYDAGVFTTIDVPFPGAYSTAVSDINDHGQMVGFYDDSTGRHGFVYDKGVFTVFDPPGAVFTPATPVPPGLSGTQPYSINNHGQIVGSYTTRTEDGALVGRNFLYSAGVFTSIEVPGAISTAVRGINNHGQIVGRYIDSSDVDHGFVATPPHKATDSNDTLSSLDSK